jgi:beta-galactosidase
MIDSDDCSIMQKVKLYKMMSFNRVLNCVLLLLLVSSELNAQSNLKLLERFGESGSKVERIGRGLCTIENGVLKTKDAYACFGEKSWKDYEIRFSARTPASKDQVQIWAGFRAYNRDDRYMLGFRGGDQNTLYLSRMGYMGTDEFLALRPLHFHPETGKWYDFRIEVCDDRIRVFLNNEILPRIDVTDKNSYLAPSGKITLGGGWIETEFDSLSIINLPANHLRGKAVVEYTVALTAADKEKKRQSERSDYQPIQVNNLSGSRTEVSLNGQWLFMPEYELGNEHKAVSPATNDNQWHVMPVPSFWNPIRIWLHGETFGPHAKGVSDNYFQNETERCENYTFDYKKTAAAWYRQWVELPGTVKNKNIELIFDAVSKVAEVYINGTKAGSNIGMFGEFKVNGTGLFKPGKNLVTVKVTRDYIKDIQDANKVVDVAVSVDVTNKMLKDLAHGFYGGDPAGIWQPVTMIITDPVKINDVFIKPNLTGAAFEVTIKNNGTGKSLFSVETSITDKVTLEPLFAGENVKNIELAAGEERVLTYQVNNLKPKLWSPESPNLYDFSFRLITNKREIDKTIICSGFRTFESKNGYLWLNGKRYWLRGANQTPFALAPNSRELADSFFHLMKAANIDITRTHTSPYNELWMEAADRNGIGISFEGTWPWLMINGTMPDKKLLDLWADEFLVLLKKYRNHPSLLLWTVNNEMKFYDNDPDFERAKLKMSIISDVVKRMRKTDPTRPICFDSNYKRNIKKFGKDFFNNIDDGDIDDIHSYINWYDYTVFKQFKGEFQHNNLNEGRPLISQEMSTGYPNAETGHATRFYNIVHQNPQSLIGNLSYENIDPAKFLEVHSFITQELAEALRRTNDKASGILHFSLVTWFRNGYDPKKIEPYPVYYAMKNALRPVLVSAELWGRHFYAGEKLPARICVVNDKEDGSDLQATTLSWKLVGKDKNVIAKGNCPVPLVKHYAREWVEPGIIIPANLPFNKAEVQLVLTLKEDNQLVSENEYKVVVAKKEWSESPVSKNKKVVLVDNTAMKDVFDSLKIKYTMAGSVSEALKLKADLYVFSGINPNSNCSVADIKQIRTLVSNGNKVLLLNSEEATKEMYPEYIKDWIVPTDGDIVNMEIPESPIFDGIDPLELRYFNNNMREIPTVCHAAFKINRNPNVTGLAEQIKIHGYVNAKSMEQRSDYMETIKGFPIVKIKDSGSVITSVMSLEKAPTDPVAGKLLSNMINDLLK